MTILSGVRWKDTWCYIYILLEFQNTQDYWMALRIATYTGLLWQELVNENQVKAGEKLPPVLPIVLYNGQNPWNAPLNVGELVAPVHSKTSQISARPGIFFCLTRAGSPNFCWRMPKGSRISVQV